MSRLGFTLTLLAAGLLAAPAMAETLTFQTTMSGAKEVPPKQTNGTGQVTATLDTVTKVLTYKVTYSGLTGPATMGHFHGPAAPGVNAGVAVPFKMPIASPDSGSVTLTDKQIADLEAGKWYANVHTAANPAGEIRGQMMQAK